MRVILKGIDEGNIEKLAMSLSELGINPAPLYRSLREGRHEAEIECEPGGLPVLKSRIGDLCQIIPLETSQHKTPSLYLLALFLDTLLLFYILKLSVWSEDFNSMLGRLFQSSKAAVWSQALLSLFLIGLYNHAFFNLKGSPPISRLLGVSYRKDTGLIMIAYSLPLIALYLLNMSSTLIRLAGLGLLSLSVALVVYYRD